MAGLPISEARESPPPPDQVRGRPSPARGEGTLRQAPRLICSHRHLLCRAAAALGFALALAVGSASATPAAKPTRIVSLDLCTDQLLIELVERTRIAAVTHLAADPANSAIPEKARSIPVTRGGAEDVLRYDPDLVLAGPFGVTSTVSLLRRLKRKVVVVPLAADLDGVRAAVRATAAAVGEERRGEAMLAQFDRRLASLPPIKPGPAPSAVVYEVGGAVAGAGSLADAALAAAGLRNMAGEYRLTRSGQAPLELLAARPPDLIVLSSVAGAYSTVVADNLRHPALQILRRSRASVELPWQLWLCGTPHVADAIARLAEARAAIEARR